LVGIVLFEWFGHGLNIFDVSRGENPYAIFGSFLMILLFGSFISTIWHYQTRGGISIIICFSLVLIYVIIFPMLTQLSNPSWAADFTDFLRFLWLLLPLPIYFLLLVSIGLPGIFIFMKSEVES
jgi:hypothetical protein